MADDGGRRVGAETLAAAVASVGALADAYSKSEKSELAGDPEAAAVVRGVVATLEAFARARRVQDETRARSVLANALRAVYERVLSGGGESPESEAPPSRRRWHEGVWTTDIERRAAVARIIARCVPVLAENETIVAAADLSAEQIEARGGARTAAEAVVTTIFDARPPVSSGPDLRGATVFGLPLA
jgi:hypothetical protein